MRTTARVFGFIPVGLSRRLALGLLTVAALSVASSGCGTGSEALPSDLPPPSGGGALVITTTAMEDGVINRSYSKALDTVGGTPPLASCTFSAGTPPPGLNIAASGTICVVVGTPTLAGSFSFTVRAADQANISDTQDYTVVIRDEFTITGMAPDPLPDGAEDRAYNFAFTVTTDTVIGPDDFGEVAENGNGPLTQCGLTGLPAGMNAVGGNFTGNSCQVTVSGTPNIGLGPMSAPMTFQLTLGVRDTGIAGSSTPPGLVTQTAIDLTIQPPVSFTLTTGGTFNDATSGGNAPVAVNGRTYGAPARMDLLFTASGGIQPYTWANLSGAADPDPFVCTQSGANGEFFACNSNNMPITTAGGTATTLTVQVQDAGSAATAPSAQGTDINGHANHSIFVNGALVVVSDLGDPLPDAVMGQMYGEAPGFPATFTASGGTCDPTVNGSCSFSTAASISAPGAAFPTTIACATSAAPNANRFACATMASTITAATGTYMPTVDVTDVANDTTPAAAGTMVTVSVDVVPDMMFSLITADAGTTMACTGGVFDDTNFAGTSDAIRAVRGRTYGGPNRCDLLFQVTGGRPPYQWAEQQGGPSPVGCTQEGANSEFFRCNGGGAAIDEPSALQALIVLVLDTSNVALPSVVLDTDDQGHNLHLIGIQDAVDIVVEPQGSNINVAPDGVFMRPYGTPGGGQDLVFRVPPTSGLGPITMRPDDNSMAGDSASQGFPADLVCTQTVDRQIDCTTGGGVITDAAGVYMLRLTAVDVENDTTTSFGLGTDFFLTINDEIVIPAVLFTNGITGQPYSHTFTCDPMVGSCGGTGAPNNAAAQYTWSEVGGPAHADLSVSTTDPNNPSTGQYSGTPTTTGTNLMPEISVTDDGNLVAPSCQAAMTCPSFIPTFSIFAPMVVVDAVNNEVDTYETTGGALMFNSNITLDAGSQPNRVAITPNASFAVSVDSAESQADIIDLATGGITNLTVNSQPLSVTIGPATNPLANPDSWVAYVASFAGNNVDIVDVDPNSAGFGTVTGSVAFTNPRDVAITPTLAGETRVYVLASGDAVCVIDAEPSSGGFGTQIDLTGTIGTACIDTSGVAGDTLFIEVASGFAFVTKSSGMLVSIDITPGSGTRDTIVDTEDLTANGCNAPGDLRGNPGGTQLWVACGADDLVAIVDPFTTDFLTSFSTGMTTSPQDVAFSIDGSFAVVTLNTTDEILPVSIDLMSGVATPGMAEALANVQSPEGIDHNQDPQLNALVSASFPIQVGQPATRQVAARGGVQPYTYADSSGALGVPGTACQGLSLDSLTGRIRGVPMTPGTCTFTVKVSDSNGQSRTVEGRIEVKP